MAKSVRGKPTKKSRSKRGNAGQHDAVVVIDKEFRFPSNKAVQIVGSVTAKTTGANAALRKLQRTYKSAGHEIMGTTSDGVVIVRPSGKPNSFTLTELQEAFSGPNNTKFGGDRAALRG